MAMTTKTPKKHGYPRNFPPMEAFDQIDAFCEGSGITKIVVDLAKYFFKEAHGGGLFRYSCGNHNAMVAGCIFIACRQSELPRSFQEISKLTNVSKSDVGKIFKLLDMYFSSQTYFKLEGEEGNSAETAYGSYTSLDPYRAVNILTLDAQTINTRTRLVPRPMPKTFAIDGVASSVLNRSATSYLRSLLTGLKMMGQADRQSVSRLLASLLPAVSWARTSPGVR